MTHVAFYAPMKPPDHPVPSGDRAMARNLVAAIGARATVDLVSRLQVHDGIGEVAFQSEMQSLALAETDRLIVALADTGTGLWVTYHNYYKSPDLIGPVVCRALNLPYVQIETSRARSRLSGPWAGYAAAAEAASDTANVILYLINHDLDTLSRDRTAGQRLVHLRPFLPTVTLPAAADYRTGPMLSVGMMRARDKLDSYRVIADTLAMLPAGWQLEIAGDGPARTGVEALMARFGDRVTFLGQLDPAGLAQAYARASLFFWPGVNEAYGMVYLEAQAAGLPVVAQDRPGVRDVVLSGICPDPAAGPPALAKALSILLNDPETRRKQGRAGREKVARCHLIGSARDVFWSAVTPLLEDRR